MSDFIWYGSPNEHLEDLQRRLRTAQLEAIRGRVRLQQRVERLEQELAWTSAVASALAAHCIEKGLMTDADLRERIAKVETARAEAEKAAAAAAPPAPAKPRRHPLRRRPR